MRDLVSIIMPAYNTGRFLRESVNSVLAQTYTEWELIIVDDCSTDDGDAVAATFSDPRIRYLKNETNSGAAVSRNRALREARGRWIAFLDSDDVWYPEKLEKQIAFMEENAYSFSYTNYVEMDEESRDTGVFVTGPARISKTGMDIKKNNDYAMWLKVIKKENCYLLPETLARYRKRAGSISNHGYTKLVKWHYRLFRYAEGKNPVSAAVHTLRNLVFGVYKKLRYVKKQGGDMT